MAGIFKSYDIRGLCPGELDEALAERLGAATADFLGANKLALGWDMRPTSPGSICNVSAMLRGTRIEASARNARSRR